MRFSLRLLALAPLALVGACAPSEVTGPFTGSPHRFSVDSIELPRSRAELADDLNGDGKPDDQLGAVVAALAGQGWDPGARVTFAPASRPIVTLLTDDDSLQSDPAAGAIWQAAPDSGDAVTLGGVLAGGRFVSNRARTTTAPALGSVELPLYDGAAPIALNAVGLEMELTADGAGGFDGELHAAVAPDLAARAAYEGLLGLLRARPEVRPLLLSVLDGDGDGQISLVEFTSNVAARVLLAPDVQLFDANGRWAPNPANQVKDSLSIGIGFHLSPDER
jgi:hypothetical protein